MSQRINPVKLPSAEAMTYKYRISEGSILREDPPDSEANGEKNAKPADPEDGELRKNHQSLLVVHTIFS